MCGIAGFIDREGDDANLREREILLDRMCRLIIHRGPDEQGTAIEGRAALGMRRLSIIDLKTGQQPIYNEDKDLLIIFNGEIYNYLELKRNLESRGYKFKTNSDTETILHAYEEFGERCVDHLRGMFAFAIWNKREESLFIARDRVGKKPLFYSLTEKGVFVFASEMKSLLLHPETRREIDLPAFDAYLTFGYVPEEFCIFKNVRKLQPGHFLVFKNGKITTERYWDFNFEPAPEILAEREYVARLRELIKESVGIRLISEVPLGAFLSGGVDSSTVVGMMSEVLEQPVKTFSIGFNEDTFNELKYARIAAKHFRTDHHEFIVTPDLVQIVDELVWHFDEPFADSSALPTFMVSKMAREFVTVVLSGDGGDELFAGYTRYATDQKRGIFSKLPAGLRRGIAAAAKQLPHGFFGKNFLYNASLDSVSRYIDSVSHLNRLHKEKIYSTDFQASLNGAAGAGEKVFQRIAADAKSDSSLDRLLYLDSKTYLPSDILVKVDRMSMANSLEARVPLLDHKLIEFVSKIPASMKMHGFESKYIFRKAIRGLVPDEILDRPKQGFGVPINDWINDQLRTRIHGELGEPRTLERGYFEKSYIKLLLDEHSRGRRDHSHTLWMLWMLELWHRRYIDRAIA
jgi:asparagine synthase (glutamine-hydrolysing)